MTEISTPDKANARLDKASEGDFNECVSTVASLQNDLKALQILFTVAKFVKPITCLQISSINTIGRSKHEAKESSPMFALVCHATLDINLKSDLRD